MMPEPAGFEDPEKHSTGHDDHNYTNANWRQFDKAKSSTEEEHCMAMPIVLDLVIVELLGRNNVAWVSDEPVGN